MRAHGSTSVGGPQRMGHDYGAPRHRSAAMRTSAYCADALPGSLTLQPPSTVTTCPVTILASSERRWSATAVTASVSIGPAASGCFARRYSHDPGVVLGTLAHGRRDQRRGDRVDPDPIGGVRGRGRPREPVDRPLARRVAVGPEVLGGRVLREHARHQEDRPARAVRVGLLGEHPLERGPRDEELARRVRREDGLPALERRLVEGPVAEPAAADAQRRCTRRRAAVPSCRTPRTPW